MAAEDVCSENNFNPFGIDYGTPLAEKRDFLGIRVGCYLGMPVVVGYAAVRPVTHNRRDRLCNHDLQIVSRVDVTISRGAAEC
jgi:hypothetical protein